MNSDAPYESAVRTSLIPFMEEGTGDNFNKKKGHYGFKAYPYPNILIHLVNWTTYMLPYRSKKAFIFLKFNTKKKGGQIATLNFSKWGGKLSPVPSSMNGISEVRTADSYGASEFMSVRILSGVCVAQSSEAFILLYGSIYVVQLTKCIRIFG
jgi:hypothetical protein